ncbi:MAG: chorismate-binding protein [bacterium]|nr:chorismate-binding protein [bacterium]
MMGSDGSWPGQARTALADLGRRLALLPVGPCELAAPLADPPSPFAWLDCLPRHVARAQFGRGRLGLDAVWRRDGADLELLAQDGPFRARWFSLPFDLDAPAAGEWAPFGRVRCWTPRLEWRAGQGLVLRLLNGADPGERAHCRRLLGGLARRVARPAPRDPVGAPHFAPDGGGRPAWLALAREALGRIGDEADPLDKLVLARWRTARLPAPATSATLLEAVSRRDPAVWPYLLAWPGGGELLGATPEWLFRRRRRQVACLALAGTRRRGATPALDRILARDLLASGKDRHEQEVVSAWLAEALRPLLAGPPRTGRPRLRRLATLQHIESRLGGHLRPEVDDAALLAALHPTPALCGRPRGEARRWLRIMEDGRGLCGGVLGILEASAAEARVVIRCALRSKRTLRLWAGAGLVAGSRPEEEWEETGWKLGALVAAWGDES